MQQRLYQVRIGARLVTEVYYNADMSAREVRRSLIDHDGMPANISVYKVSMDKARFTDMARATHPEEL